MATSNFTAPTRLRRSNQDSRWRQNETFKKEFDKLAVNGVIGDPSGKPAYAYLRVSSDEQGEEGRSGLPRQIRCVHDIAEKLSYCVTWDRVFADDFTGFELERPELSRLRREYCGSQSRAAVVVMEHPDRLSRNAKWHQGYLLDEMEEHGILPVFWKSYNSETERAVMGTISQESIVEMKRRARQGMIIKAESGRITARKPAYGYKFVDDQGKEGERAKRFTYYAIREDEAAIVRQIYQRIALGDSLFQIADDLNRAHVPPPKKSRYWEPVILRQFVKSPVYRGEYIAYRWKTEKKVVTDEYGVIHRREKRRIELPESEWIRVPVPPTVDVGLWQDANAMLKKNRTMSKRNAKQPYLLTGLLKCAECGYAFTGKAQWIMHGKRLETPYRFYYCTYRLARGRYVEDEPHCSQGSISANMIENAVWNAICEAMLTPHVLIRAIETDLFSEKNKQIEQQIAYLEAEIASKPKEDEKLYKAYVAGAFDETEFTQRRKALKAETALLTAELDELRPQRVTQESFESQKQTILESAKNIGSLDAGDHSSFEVKQKILKMIVSRIELNAHEKWFRLEGVLRGTYSIENIPASGISSAGVK